MRYFDPIKKQLIYISDKSTPDFWDAHWEIDENIRDRILGTKDTLISKITKRYLKPSDGTILEGGCGTGQFVASLSNNGYRVIGLDLAYKTVKTLNQYVPELDIILGDVRKIPFPDKLFSAYWSLGVIEHFWEGYEALASEMFRVINDNGYLFLTFPYMSPLRRIKGKLGLYNLWQNTSTNDFHQFALNSRSVIYTFEKKGFKLLKAIPHDALTGIQHEIPVLKPLIQPLLDYSPHYKFVGFSHTIINKIMSAISSHCILLIFNKFHR